MVLPRLQSILFTLLSLGFQTVVAGGTINSRRGTKEHNNATTACQNNQALSQTAEKNVKMRFPAR